LYQYGIAHPYIPPDKVILKRAVAVCK